MNKRFTLIWTSSLHQLYRILCNSSTLNRIYLLEYSHQLQKDQAWILAISYYGTGFSYSSHSVGNKSCSARPIGLYITRTRLLLILCLSSEQWFSLTPSHLTLQVFFKFDVVRKICQNSSSSFNGTLGCFNDCSFFQLEMSEAGLSSEVRTATEMFDEAGERHFVWTARTCKMFCSNSYFLQQIIFDKNMMVAGDRQGFFFSAKSLFPVYTVLSDAAWRKSPGIAVFESSAQESK